MQIEIKSVDANGDGYCVVYRDDGTSFGQMFHGLPVHDETVFLNSLNELVKERDKAPSSRVITPSILGLIGVKLTPQPKLTENAA